MFNSAYSLFQDVNIQTEENEAHVAVYLCVNDNVTFPVSCKLIKSHEHVSQHVCVCTCIPKIFNGVKVMCEKDVSYSLNHSFTI